MYENFNAPSTKSLDSIFNRLQKTISQLAILGENISQEDLNLKILRSLPYEWNTYVVVWRNKHDLDITSFDDLYNNFKIVEQEDKGTASSSSISTANTQVSPVSTQVSTASTQVNIANLSNDTVYAFLASQPNGSQLVYEDLEQIHKDDIEEIDLKWQLALLSMRTRRFFQKTGRKITINGSDIAGYDKSKVECFNCHKIGHFARKYRGPKKQDSRNRNQDSSRRTINVEETSSKATVAIDGAGLFSPPKFDLSNSSLEEFQQPEFEGYGPKTSKSVSKDISNEVRESPDAPLVKELVSDDKLEKKIIFLTVAKIEFFRPKQQEKSVRKPVKQNSAVVNAVRTNQVNAVKDSTCWVWRPTKLNSASITLKKHNYVDARGRSNDAKAMTREQCPISQTSRNLMEDMLPLGEEPQEGKLLVKELLKQVSVTPSNLSMQRNVEYPRALLYGSIAQDLRTTTKRVV
ncbi:ribonuclease H-like domain-containing protein [Tanacetum coccineum]